MENEPGVAGQYRSRLSIAFQFPPGPGRLQKTVPLCSANRNRRLSDSADFLQRAIILPRARGDSPPVQRVFLRGHVSTARASLPAARKKLEVRMASTITRRHSFRCPIPPGWKPGSTSAKDGRRCIFRQAPRFMRCESFLLSARAGAGILSSAWLKMKSPPEHPHLHAARDRC